MISLLTRLCFLILFAVSVGCTTAPGEKEEQEPSDSTTHFNDSTEAV